MIILTKVNGIGQYENLKSLPLMYLMLVVVRMERINHWCFEEVIPTLKKSVSVKLSCLLKPFDEVFLLLYRPK